MTDKLSSASKLINIQNFEYIITTRFFFLYIGRQKMIFIFIEISQKKKKTFRNYNENQTVIYISRTSHYTAIDRIKKY